jgi:transcriptional regulator with PAS, ATPase and Fis domain
LLLNGARKPAFTEHDLSLLKMVAAIASPFIHCTQAIPRYFASPQPRHVLLDKYARMGMLGKGEKFADLLSAIEAAARCDVTILLEGESGTGKELVARAVHRLSSRSQNRFVAIDCGAIQPHLVESELFGHIKGAFTGAMADRKGLLEEANGGTLFMDEINNLPLEMQPKLLRVLEDQEIRPIGTNQTRTIDVRIISASSSSLRKLVAEKTFREDLYYRLNVYPIAVPSLHERVEDIPMLVEHFLKKFGSEQKKEIDGVHEEILDLLKQRRWTGNVRELSNVVERLVTLTTKKQKIIDRKVLPPDLQKELKRLQRTHEDIRITKSLSESLADCEEQLIRNTLESCSWNRSRAARILRISEHSMRYKMARLGIEKPS